MDEKGTNKKTSQTLEIESDLKKDIEKFEIIQNLLFFVYKFSENFCPNQRQLTGKPLKYAYELKSKDFVLEWIKNLKINPEQEKDDYFFNCLKLMQFFVQEEAERKATLVDYLNDEILLKTFKTLEHDSGKPKEKIKRLLHQQRARFIELMKATGAETLSEKTIVEFQKLSKDVKFDLTNFIGNESYYHHIITNYIDALKDYHKNVYEVLNNTAEELKSITNNKVKNEGNYTGKNAKNLPELPQENSVRVSKYSNENKDIASYGYKPPMQTFMPKSPHILSRMSLMESKVKAYEPKALSPQIKLNITNNVERNFNRSSSINSGKKVLFLELTSNAQESGNYKGNTKKDLKKTNSSNIFQRKSSSNNPIKLSPNRLAEKKNKSSDVCKNLKEQTITENVNETGKLKKTPTINNLPSDFLMKLANNVEKTHKKSLYIPNTKYVALYNFMTGIEEDLKLKKGDVLTLVQDVDENWACGYTDNTNFGIFPKCYVKLVE